jgi:UrcA family protein
MNAQTKKTRTLATVIACAGTFGLALAAHAGDVATAPVPRHDDVVVRYADLNLATEEGARTLYARLAAAAERACGSAPRTLALTEHMRYRACYDSTLTRAVEKIGSQQVHALHAARTDSSVG